MPSGSAPLLFSTRCFVSAVRHRLATTRAEIRVIILNVFYREKRQIRVRVGMEAIGYSRWFERLLAELGFEVWIGGPAEFKTRRVKKPHTNGHRFRTKRQLWSYCGQALETPGVEDVLKKEFEVSFSTVGSVSTEPLK